MRRESFDSVVNLSINQTLSRTILTSGLTFLTALALWLFGGQVLNGFAFALVAGIIFRYLLLYLHRLSHPHLPPGMDGKTAQG
jgi:preprotein translocase subunit SecF